jgi:hypothetical protein
VGEVQSRRRLIMKRMKSNEYYIYSQLFRTVHSNINSVQHKISLDVPIPFVIQRLLYYGISIGFPYLFIDFSLLPDASNSSTNPLTVFFFK